MQALNVSVNAPSHSLSLRLMSWGDRYTMEGFEFEFMLSYLCRSIDVSNNDLLDGDKDSFKFEPKLG